METKNKSPSIKMKNQTKQAIKESIVKPKKRKVLCTQYLKKPVR